jgi:hypothetical protein
MAGKRKRDFTKKNVNPHISLPSSFLTRKLEQVPLRNILEPMISIFEENPFIITKLPKMMVIFGTFQLARHLENNKDPSQKYPFWR